MNRWCLAAMLMCFVAVTSCNFDKQILRPRKLDPNTTKLYMQVAKTDDSGHVHMDTTEVINFGEHYQPTFTDIKGRELEKDYTVESVLFTNNAGTMLNGWMVKPKHTNKRVTLLFLHGIRSNIIREYPKAVALAEQGYQVFVPDYSGFGFSEGKATRANVPMDAEAALAYLRKRPDVMGTHLLLYGQSMGAHFTPEVALSDTVAEGMILEGGFESWKAEAAFHVKHGVGFVARLFTKEDYNVKKALKLYNRPVLVIHSNSDEVVPVNMGRKLYNDANEPKSYFEISKCHVCGPLYYPEQISGKIMELIKQ